MSGLNELMGRGIIPPVVHGILDYPLAAVLIVLPLVLSFDDAAAKWIAFAFGIGAAVLAVGTAWPTGIVRIIPPLLHGYADISVTAALIVLPFIVGFSDHTTALVFYLAVGAAGLVATLLTRFGPRVREERGLKPGASFDWTSYGFSVTSTVYDLAERSRVLWGGTAGGITGVHEWLFSETPSGVHVTTTESFSGEPVQADARGMQTVLDASLVAWLGHLKVAAESSP